LGEYNEIQIPKRKSVLIDYQKLAKLTGFASYRTFRETHKELVNESVTNRARGRQPGGSESVAVGSRSFVETIHSKLGFRGKGRKVSEHDIGFQLREEHRAYNAEDDGKNEDIGTINTSEWDVNFG
jgi:putative transposase